MILLEGIVKQKEVRRIVIEVTPKQEEYIHDIITNWDYEKKNKNMIEDTSQHQVEIIDPSSEYFGRIGRIASIGCSVGAPSTYDIEMSAPDKDGFYEQINGVYRNSFKTVV